MTEIIKKTLDAINKNNMQGFYAENAKEAKDIALSLIEKGATVSHGGSMTLKDIGLLDSLKNGDYVFLDRSLAKTPEELKATYRSCFSADVYLSSSNAVTETGELYNIDGTGNRIAAITYGPDSVIIIVGKNKIVKNLSEAVDRVRRFAAPPNCKRLSKETYCHLKGYCQSADTDCTLTDNLTAGCKSPDRICRDYLITSIQAIKNRIKVIIVNEDLGY